MSTSKETEAHNVAVNTILETLWQFPEQERFMVIACAWSALVHHFKRNMTDEAGRMCAIHSLLEEDKVHEAQFVAGIKT